jgi:hypothetical protein
VSGNLDDRIRCTGFTALKRALTDGWTAAGFDYVYRPVTERWWTVPSMAESAPEMKRR